MISRFARSFLAIVAALLILSTVALLHPPSRAYMNPWTGELFSEGGVEADLFHVPSRYKGIAPSPYVKADDAPLHGAGNVPSHMDDVPLAALPNAGSTLQSNPGDASEDVVQGGVIMSKLGNATAKAALGRATWKLLHTMTLRYPEKPTQDERNALNDYFHLTARLYPCGECAAEFQQLLKRMPPQTSSRRSAALWLCHLHNQVNERLHKPEFDCAHLDDTYDCGCGDAPVGDKRKPDGALNGGGDRGVDDVTGVGLIKGGR